MSESKKTDLSIGDSIGLAAFLFAVLTVIWTPSVLFKITLFIFASIGIVVALRISHWTHAWARSKQIFSASFLIIVLAWLCVPGLDSQLREQHVPTILDRLTSSWRVLRPRLVSPDSQRVIFTLVGVALTLSIQHLWQQIKPLIRRESVTVYPKGLLDYKLEAELAMDAYPKVLAKITEVTAEVGKMLEKETARARDIQKRSTATHLAFVADTAHKLDGFTSQLERDVLELEEVGRQFQEGQLGWFKAVRIRNGSSGELEALVPHIKDMCTSIQIGLTSISEYITTFTRMNGVSSELDAAVHRHVRIVTQIHDISQQLRASSLEGIAILETAENSRLDQAS